MNESRAMMKGRADQLCLSSLLLLAVPEAVWCLKKDTPRDGKVPRDIPSSPFHTLVATSKVTFSSIRIKGLRWQFKVVVAVAVSHIHVFIIVYQVVEEDLVYAEIWWSH